MLKKSLIITSATSATSEITFWKQKETKKNVS